MCSRRFTVIDETFACGSCGRRVTEHPDGSCRNHCPHCLYSCHLDINPGDRAAGCGGLMKPVKAVLKGMDKVTLIHSCEKCGHESRNKTASDDHLDGLLALMRSSNLR